jgi:hypothetical protein
MDSIGAVKRRTKNNFTRHPTPHTTRPIHCGIRQPYPKQPHNWCGVCQSLGFEGKTHRLGQSRLDQPKQVIEQHKG